MAFGRRLAEQPLMRNVLADLALESEAATLLVLRLARAFDGRHARDEHEALIARVLTPATKYWICKRLPAAAAEALEVMGGNGYVEEGPFARFYREAPLNSIWEGSGNVMCLDVLRALARAPAVRGALVDELAAARGVNATYDAYVGALARELDAAQFDEAHARRLSEQIALAMQASLLVTGGQGAVADAFCASRLQPDATRGAFGTLRADVDFAALLARALPA
jgi:putative acyl-CoA dehydrogenase